MLSSVMRPLSLFVGLTTLWVSAAVTYAQHPNYEAVMARNARPEKPWHQMQLVDTEGKLFTGADHKGKLILVDFFFTSCPTICPPQTAGLVKVWDRLSEKEKASLVFLSISLDPQNDTPAKLKDYKKRFGIQSPSWIFARTQDAGQLGQYFGSTEKDKDPLLHKGRVYLVGPDGMFLTSYASAPIVDAPKVARELAGAIRTLIEPMALAPH